MGNLLNCCCKVVLPRFGGVGGWFRVIDNSPLKGKISNEFCFSRFVIRLAKVLPKNAMILA